MIQCAWLPQGYSQRMCSNVRKGRITMPEKHTPSFANNPFLTKEGICAMLIWIGGCGVIYEMGLEEYLGIVLSIVIAVVAGFFLCYYKSGRPNSALLRFSFILILLLSCMLLSFELESIECNGPFMKSKGMGMLLWIGIILYGLFESVANRIRARRRKSCLAEIIAWNNKHGIEDEPLAICADDGECYCIVGLDNEKQIGVNIDSRPNKNGYYKCAWVWNDPKDGEYYFLTPDNYKILFCFDTGSVEMEGLDRK